MISKRAILALTLTVLVFLMAHAAAGQDVPPAPKGYPKKGVEDAYALVPFEDSYEARRQAFLEFQVRNPGRGPYSEAVRVAMGLPPDEGRIQGALDRMNERGDCADFGLHGILRLLYQFGDSPLLSDGFRARSRESILNFKYWPDEPGTDSLCTWSENHHILYAAGGYLAGQLFPDEVFTNSGQTGREKMAICRPRVERWLELRYRTGFSEWLSNVYYEEDLAPIINLVDFCEDEEIAGRAAMVADLLIMDMAVNSFRGAFGSTHGRTYEKNKKSAHRDSTRSATKLLFGMNRFRAGGMMAPSLVLSEKYRMPPVIYEIAADVDRAEMVNRQRMGIRIKDAKQWGLSTKRLEDGMTFLSLEAYTHPKTINLTMRMMDQYGWWDNEFFDAFNQVKGTIDRARKWHVLPLVARYYEKDLTRNAREEVNIYTYRTPDYMLSSAQDYRKGYGGDQQHIWQATLGPEAVCFTTHPARFKRKGAAYRSPGYWTGSGNLPRVAQVENVAIVLYRISTKPGLYLTHDLLFTHAWLPKDKFDEVVERDGWVFARHGDGYLALWSRQPWRWQAEEGEDKDRELIAEGMENVWICELGRKETDGPFGAFVDRICAAPLTTRGLKVTYDSPSQGRLAFGWQGRLRRDGRSVKLGDYARYDNPYSDAPFAADEMTFRHNGQWLRLNWATVEREGSGLSW
jgi:hypothetical protein